MGYIYNIGGRYTYLVITHQYTQSGGAPTAGGAKEIGNDKFYAIPSVDFGLGQEVPDEIEVSDEVAILRKTSLERKVEEE